jgi:uncharacterized OB-fold protein/acyl dehydratase
VGADTPGARARQPGQQQAGDAVIVAAAARIAAAGQSRPRPARDPVNLPMIRNWTEALGDDCPLYADPDAAARSVHGELVAPPAMVQVWTMRGLRPAADDDDPLGLMSAVLDEAGFTSVVATNCEQEYHRYLRHGEQLSVRSSLEDITGPKRTALGEGWFVTTRSTWYSGAEPVATMLFRILKFRPPGAPPVTAAAAEPAPAGTEKSAATAPAAGVLRPVVSDDTRFFWDGTAAGELRIQRCPDCGALRHPPGPMCPACGGARPGYQVAAGTGEVYSYVVHHHPPVPGRALPIVIALVALTEGVRMVGELRGVPPERARIGMPVQVEFARIDDELTLPAWRERQEAVLPRGDDPPIPPAPPAGGREVQAGQALPELSIDVTPTFVISTALATRDFQDVHHDRDKAVARGSRDIFVNILTTTGLVQRYVTDWVGARALVRKVAIRLGAPCYAGDTLTFSGRVAECPGPGEPGGDYLIEVVGRCRLGDHVTGTVRVGLPGDGDPGDGT